MFQDRRRSPRHPVLVMATATAGAARFEVVCTNLSALGGFVACRTDLSAGAKVEFLVHVQGGDGPVLALAGTVVRSVGRGGLYQPGFAVTWVRARCEIGSAPLRRMLRNLFLIANADELVPEATGSVEFDFGAYHASAQPAPPTPAEVPAIATREPPKPAAEAQRPATHVRPLSAVGPAAARPMPAAARDGPTIDSSRPTPSPGTVPQAVPGPPAPELGAETDGFVGLRDQQISAEVSLPGGQISQEYMPVPVESPGAPVDDAPAALDQATVAPALPKADPGWPRVFAAPASDRPAEAVELPAPASRTPSQTVPHAGVQRSARMTAVPTSSGFDIAEPAASVRPLSDGFDVGHEAHGSDGFQAVDHHGSVTEYTPVLPMPRRHEVGPTSEWPSTRAKTDRARVVREVPEPDVAPPSRTGNTSPATNVPAGVAESRTAAAEANSSWRRLSRSPSRWSEPAPSQTMHSGPGVAPANSHTQTVGANAVVPTPTAAQGARVGAGSVMRRLRGGSLAADVQTTEPAARATPGPTQPALARPAPPATATGGSGHPSLLRRRQTETPARHPGPPARDFAATAGPHALNRSPTPAVAQPVARPSQPAVQPVVMVDAAVEVPSQPASQSTMAYTREQTAAAMTEVAAGKLMHATHKPISGTWPSTVPMSLRERYGRLESLGQGGHGVVYRALDRHLDRVVVLKVMASRQLSTELARKYFLREVKLAASLNHPNVMHIYDIGEADGVPYYSMEYIDGVPLTTYLPQRAAMRDLSFLFCVLSQLCDALDYAHSQGVLHRDVKPDNVLIGADGTVKLFDFGLARIADEGFGEQSELIGTPHYMAPEQLMGGKVDHRADVYALGVLLFRALTGFLPFADENVFAAHALQPVPDPRGFNPALPAGVVPIIHKIMAKKAEDRYGTCRELADDLYAALFVEAAGGWKTIG
jgi:tRNA A-37 threonylcarbamoyl transferase component Bud32